MLVCLLCQLTHLQLNHPSLGDPELAEYVTVGKSQGRPLECEKSVIVTYLLARCYVVAKVYKVLYM